MKRAKQFKRVFRVPHQRSLFPPQWVHWYAVTAEHSWFGIKGAFPIAMDSENFKTVKSLLSSKQLTVLCPGVVEALPEECI